MNGIVYLMSGPAHLHYLVPSLVTLREHWRGPVTVYAFPESYELVKAIAGDLRLDVEAKLYSPRRITKKANEQFVNKVLLLSKLDLDCALYLDADTTIHGDVQHLFDCAEEHGFAATQFNTWLSTGSVIRNRLERLRTCPKICKQSLDMVLTEPYPSLNGGVLCCDPRSPVLPLWHDWSMDAQGVFIADECCLHVLQVFAPKETFFVVEGGIYNCSHKYRDKSGIRHEDVRIYHYHGDSNVRPGKSPEAHAQWWPLYKTCLDKNYGHILDWRHAAPNEWITALGK